MPAIRRKARNQRYTVDTITRAQRTHLLCSWRSLGRIFETLEEFTEAWEAVRDEVMPRYIEKNPGSRPFAWWRVDHGKELPVVEPEIDDQRINYDRSSDRHWQTFGYLWNAFYLESQELYLRRNGLLLPGEDEAISAKKAERAARCKKLGLTEDE